MDGRGFSPRHSARARRSPQEGGGMLMPIRGGRGGKGGVRL